MVYCRVIHTTRRLPLAENTIWSTYVQRSETLYRTRALRFRDENSESLLKVLGFTDGISILEVGCGPGAFCHALERWLPEATITGIDKDSEFIRFAAEKSTRLNSTCRFLTGDATALDFPEDTFDATTSHTVAEHVETSSFLREQYRVLKNGGILTVLTVRKGLSLNPESWQPDYGEEKELWEKIDTLIASSDTKYGVAGYSITETELLRKMEESGLHDISAEFLVKTAIPDNAGMEPETVITMIETSRQIALDSIMLVQNAAPGAVSGEEIEKLTRLVNKRFDNRIRLYESGQKVWDVSASVLMVARGIK